MFQHPRCRRRAQRLEHEGVGGGAAANEGQQLSTHNVSEIRQIPLIGNAHEEMSARFHDAGDFVERHVVGQEVIEDPDAENEIK